MTQLYPFQQKAVKKIHRLRGRCLLAHDMGLGKSLMSLQWAKEDLREGPVVVVCPASLKWNWQNEITVHLGWRSTVLEGKSSKGKRLSRKTPIHIVNFDILKNWVKKLKALNPKLIILDEAHALKNPRTQRTRHCKELCKDVPHVLALTGTPVLNRPAELYPLLNILQPRKWKSPTKFYFRYCRPTRVFGKWQYTGAARLPELHVLLKRTVMCRCRKEDVLDQLPARMDNICLMEIQGRRDYQKAENEFIRWLAQQGQYMPKSAMRAEFLARTSILKRLVAEKKLPYVIEWIDNFMEETDEKLIVFAHHKSVVKAIHQRFRHSVMVTGDTIGRKRQVAFDTFVKMPRCRLLVGNLQAAGVGWNAPGVSHVAFVELAWNPALHIQAGDRVRGIGRGREGVQSTSWWLMAKGTIEERICKKLQEKQLIADQTLDGLRGDVSSLNLVQELEKEILKSKSLFT